MLIGQTFGSAVEHHCHDEVLDAARAARQQPYTASIGMIIGSSVCMNERERDALASCSKAAVLHAAKSPRRNAAAGFLRLRAWQRCRAPDLELHPGLSYLIIEGSCVAAWSCVRLASMF